MYTAIFTPYVAAFLLAESDYSKSKSKKYGEDPIVIIDLIGQWINFEKFSKLKKNHKFLF